MSAALDQRVAPDGSGESVEVRPSSGYAYTLYSGIREVDSNVWNRLRRGNGDPFMDPRFLEAVEVGMAPVSRFWHVVFHDDNGAPAAIASLCSYRVDAALLADGVMKKVARGVARVLPRLLEFKVMFCGLCFSAGQSHLRFAPGVDSGVILRQLDELLLDLGRQERAKCVVFKEFSAEERPAVDALLGRGYLRADSLPMNHVQPVYRDFEDFCVKQKSSRRHVIRKSQKKFAAAGMRVVQMRGGDGADVLFTDEVYHLFENVFDKAKVRLEKETPDVFRELARKLPDETAFTFVYHEDRVVAFAASLFTSATYHQMFVGYDTQLNSTCDLYFNLFFHAIDRAYRQNVSEIHVGQSADEFKRQKLGCHQRPLYFYIKGIDWLTRVVVERFGKSLFPPRFKPPEAGGQEA